MFLPERPLYRNAELDRHMSVEAVCPTDPPEFRGHPMCEFCRQRMYDVEALFRHLSQGHPQCPFCCVSGTEDEFLFFKDSRALAEHCQGRGHFFCDADPCPVPPAQRVFQSELDLQAHQTQHHARKKGRPLTLSDLQASASSVPQIRPAQVPQSASRLVIHFAHGGNRRTTSSNLSAFKAHEPQGEPPPPARLPVPPPAPSATLPPSFPPDHTFLPAADPAPPAAHRPKARHHTERHAVPEVLSAAMLLAAMDSGPPVVFSEEQSDELEALRMIYEERLREEGGQYCVDVTPVLQDGSEDPRGPLSLRFAFVAEYPQTRGPRLRVDATWLDRSQTALLEAGLQSVSEANAGGPVLFTLVEWLKEHAGILVPFIPVETPPDRPPPRPGADVDKRFSHVEIHCGEPVTDRKSKFQAFCARVESSDEVEYVLRSLRADPKIADAAHPTIYAYRFMDAQGRLQEHRDDDGEAGAADKLLYLLQVSDARNVVVVVTRWFGGIHLSNDRFRHIGNVAKEVLQQRGFIGQKGHPAAADPDPPPAASSKGKTKSKR